jgi:peptidoglycan/xylan/chitin deacetylase (PgdA/CDA1 family)
MEIETATQAILAAAHTRPRLFRPPYLAFNASTSRLIESVFHLKIVLSSLCPNDWEDPAPHVIEERILRNVQRGDIILLHDIHSNTIEAMASVLQKLSTREFEMVTVSQALSMATPPTELHNVL